MEDGGSKCFAENYELEPERVPKYICSDVICRTCFYKNKTKYK